MLPWWLGGNKMGRSRKRHRFVHDGRVFQLWIPPDDGRMFVHGRLQPFPELKGTRTDTFGTRQTTAYLDFVLKRDDYGKFHGIGVPDEHHRQGWATVMVKALFSRYPSYRFRNSSLNEMSGPVFARIQEDLPERLVPLKRYEDGGYAVDWETERRLAAQSRRLS